MRKDVKIGMAIGSLLTVAAIVWVSTHPRLTDLGLPEEPTDAENSQPGPAVDEPGNLIVITEPQKTITPKETAAELTESATVQHEIPEKTRNQRIHTVEEGETLSGISQIYYGTASGWQKIYVANRRLLSSPDKIRPGMRLVIPE